jgi:hypothetical protein
LFAGDFDRPLVLAGLFLVSWDVTSWRAVASDIRLAMMAGSEPDLGTAQVLPSDRISIAVKMSSTVYDGSADSTGRMETKRGYSVLASGDFPKDEVDGLSRKRGLGNRPLGNSK